MSISLFSFIMAVLWFDIFIFLCSFLRRKTKFLLQYSLFPLAMIIVASILRLLISFDFPFTIIVPSNKILPSIHDALNFELIAVFGVSINVLTALIFIWITVSIALLIRTFIKLRQAYNAIDKLCVIYNERISSIMKTVAGGKNNYTILITPQIQIPMVAGFFEPRILLPSGIESFSDEEIYDILKHEWGHYQHKDQWLKLLIDILCAVMWWNIPVYLLKSNLNQMLEINCDKKTTQNMSCFETQRYALSIVKVLKQAKNSGIEHPALASNYFISSGGNEAKQRIEFILSYSHQNKRRNQWLET